ncbi:MAG: DUF4349 domain-containing protein [Treponema sp.]|jgi:hypothetical protein|nr:DUF4349 domain-containing protein [Treponema sp.]
MRKYFLLFLAASFLAFGCEGKGQAASEGFTRGMAYDDSAVTTSWIGTGFNPEGPAGVEGEDAPRFRNLSNLYGNASRAEDYGSNADEPEIFTIENTGRKIVKRANIRIRVENPEAADIFINDLMERYGAYAASAVIDENSHRYYIRVPSAAYKNFLAGMDGMGKIIGRLESAEDVTVRYYDLEGRLETRKELLKTFQSYLGKAKNIEEILSVERKIAELQSEIDRTGSELRGLANDVDFSTIDLVILGPVASISYRYPTLADRIKELFSSFGRFLSSLAVIIISIVIFGVPVVLLLVFFFWILFGRVGLLKKLWRMAMDRESH